jgi:hypothetical protein
MHDQSAPLRLGAEFFFLTDDLSLMVQLQHYQVAGGFG